jgi:hypothetical protein
MKRILQLLSIIIGLTVIAAPSHARNYDCSKAGNANKAVCKTAAAAPAAPAVRHYDCTKAGNANKTACKGAATASAPAAAPAPAPAAPRVTRAAPARPAAPTTVSAAGPDGATAQCNDGTYSHAAHRSGACSHHGGVKTWY